MLSSTLDDFHDCRDSVPTAKPLAHARGSDGAGLQRQRLDRVDPEQQRRERPRQQARAANTRHNPGAGHAQPFAQHYAGDRPTLRSQSDSSAWWSK